MLWSLCSRVGSVSLAGVVEVAAPAPGLGHSSYSTLVLQAPHSVQWMKTPCTWPSDVHQQSSTVRTQKINRVQTGVRNRREVARATESGRFHQSQLPLRMRHGRYLARIIRSELRLDLLGNGLVLISIVPH
jgi:hypothetical protein